MTPTPTAVGMLPSGTLVMGAKVGYVGVSLDIEGAPIYDGPDKAYPGG